MLASTIERYFGVINDNPGQFNVFILRIEGRRQEDTL